MKRYIKAAIKSLGDEDPETRKDIAKSISDNPDVVAELSSDKDRKVRGQLARNPNTPADVLDKLSTDRSYKVRLAVIGNPNTSSETLSKMAKDLLPKCDGYSYSDNKNDICRALLRNEKTPLDLRLKLLNTTVGNYCAYELLMVAKSKRTPTALLDAMANVFIGRQHYSSDVLVYIADNPNTSANTLRKIAEHYNNGFGISTALCKNPNTPSDVLVKIAKDSMHYNAYDSDAEVMALLMKHPNCPDNIKSEYKAMLAQYKKKTSLRPYIGKDIWLAGESYGIARDFRCYFRIVSVVNSRKKIYNVNILYDDTSYNGSEPIEKIMQDIEEYCFDEDSEDSNGRIYLPAETYTTEELIKELYGEYEED